MNIPYTLATRPIKKYTVPEDFEKTEVKQYADTPEAKIAQALGDRGPMTIMSLSFYLEQFPTKYSADVIVSTLNKMEREGAVERVGGTYRIVKGAKALSLQELADLYYPGAGSAQAAGRSESAGKAGA